VTYGAPAGRSSQISARVSGTFGSRRVGHKVSEVCRHRHERRAEVGGAARAG